MGDSRRRFCRLCRRSRHTSELITPNPEYSIPGTYEQRRICLDCAILVHALVEQRRTRALARLVAA